MKSPSFARLPGDPRCNPAEFHGQLGVVNGLGSRNEPYVSFRPQLLDRFALSPEGMRALWVLEDWDWAGSEGRDGACGPCSNTAALALRSLMLATLHKIMLYFVVMVIVLIRPIVIIRITYLASSFIRCSVLGKVRNRAVDWQTCGRSHSGLPLRFQAALLASRGPHLAMRLVILLSSNYHQLSCW